MIILPNTAGAVEDPGDPPQRPDGAPYRFEMLAHGLTERVYADTAEELLGALIRGYPRMSGPERLAARLRYAVRTQVVVQADINTADGLHRCTVDEQAVLLGHRNTPPEVEEWTCPVPLVLVDVYYQPLGELPRPRGLGDVAEPTNLLWLSPLDPDDFLVSLHRVGAVSVHLHADHQP